MGFAVSVSKVSRYVMFFHFGSPQYLIVRQILRLRHGSLVYTLCWGSINHPTCRCHVLRRVGLTTSWFKPPRHVAAFFFGMPGGSKLPRRVVSMCFGVLW